MKNDIGFTGVALPSMPAAANAWREAAVAEIARSRDESNDGAVYFYERDHYPLSNFSAFNLDWMGLNFDTSEQAYHWEKFAGDRGAQALIWTTRSAHDAFKVAGELRERRRADWDNVKVEVMRQILRAKADQHEYVRRKLLSTGDRELIENSWRDDYWGWGPNQDGKNLLGRLWMEVRSELRSEPPHG